MANNDRKHQRLGWIPDLPDKRDLVFLADTATTLPAAFDRRSGCPPVYDQGQLGSCTAQAIGAAVEYDRMRQKLPDWVPSRLFIYYQERVMEGTVQEDAGAMIRDGIKAVNRYGAPRESLWPYRVPSFAHKPSTAAYLDARKHVALKYQRVTNTDLHQLRACIALTGPIVIGVSVYNSFFDAVLGNVQMPLPNEPLAGGHAILLVGYDDATQRVTFRNSWGTGWGNAGYGTLPYAYVTDGNLADDAWSVTLVQ